MVIRGLVQGVGFRESIRAVAERLGLAGWVRNLSDGAVEAELEGPADQVEQAIAWCRSGPPAARVSRVERRPVEPIGETVFRIRGTPHVRGSG